MRSTDIFIELIRLAEQAGTVVSANMTESGTCLVVAQDRHGDRINFLVRMEEK